MWWFLTTSAPQHVNQLDSKEVRQLQHYDEDVQARIDAIWKRVENHLAKHNWDKDVKLNPPATLEQIEELENELGYCLAAEYKASLLVHNGSEGQFCSLYHLYSTARVLSVWKLYINYRGDGAQQRIDPDPEKVASFNWHPGWIPVASWDVYGVIVNVETGQVCYYDDDDAHHDTTSWARWLENVASRLESGKLRLEPSPTSAVGIWTDSDSATPGSEELQ